MSRHGFAFGVGIYVYNLAKFVGPHYQCEAVETRVVKGGIRLI